MQRRGIASFACAPTTDQLHTTLNVAMMVFMQAYVYIKFFALFTYYIQWYCNYSDVYFVAPNPLHTLSASSATDEQMKAFEKLASNTHNPLESSCVTFRQSWSEIAFGCCKFSLYCAQNSMCVRCHKNCVIIFSFLHNTQTTYCVPHPKTT